MMNVAELKEKLAELPDDAMMFVNGYEGGVDELDHVEQFKVRMNENTEWWYGKHEPADDDEAFDVVGYRLY